MTPGQFIASWAVLVQGLVGGSLTVGHSAVDPIIGRCRMLPPVLSWGVSFNAEAPLLVAKR